MRCQVCSAWVPLSNGSQAPEMYSHVILDYTLTIFNIISFKTDITVFYKYILRGHHIRFQCLCTEQMRMG